MDPEANWAEQKELSQLVRAMTASRDDRDRLRELQVALRDWVGRGGFPPKEWLEP